MKTLERQNKIEAFSFTGEPGSVEINASDVVGADGDDKAALPRFKMVAYTGGMMRINTFFDPIVVDFAGLKIPSQSRPIRFGHDHDAGVGHTDHISVVKGKLIAAGVISRDTEAAREIVASSKNGFPWQASITASVEVSEFVENNDSVTVNGRKFKGPIVVIRKSTLGEISFVDLGADQKTSARIKAAEQKEIDDMNGTKAKQDEVNADNEAVEPVKIEAKAKTPEVEKTPDVEAKAVATVEDATIQATKAIRDIHAKETMRSAAIRKICASKHDKIEVEAIADGWDETKTELAVLRAERSKAPACHIHASETGADVMEAAICLAGGIAAEDTGFNDKTLSAAHTSYPKGIGLQELFLEAAHANGYSGRSFKGDPRGVLEAGFSTFSLPGILSNVANKFLLAGFTSIEAAWERIAATRSVSDFKTVTSYRMSGGLEYEKVGPSGELKHGSVSEESFTNKVETFGRMFVVTRTDQINDDLGALTALPFRIGRGGGLKLNTEFWTAFMANSAFFTAARGNFADGTGSVLDVDGLTSAELLFLVQVDPDGNPLAITPKLLLVPPALLVPATQLMKSLELRDTTASKKTLTSNPHAGKFETIHSTYLSNSNITGNSALAWYLLGDKNDLPVIEVAFLNGQQSPTVERADADFNTLGIQFRGFFDFGVALQDHRGGVKMKGEV